MTQCDLSDRRLPGVLVRRVPHADLVPLVFDSPHSGTVYPDGFTPLLSREELLSTADLFVGELFENAPAKGAVLIEALFPRAFVDPNRSLDDLDPSLLATPWPHPLAPSEKSTLGKGLIWRVNAALKPIYGRSLSVEEVEGRIDGYWRPYHRTLDETMDALWARFGSAWHVNCHSMKSRTTAQDAEGPGHARVDIVLSDRDGQTCDRAFLEVAHEALRAEGLSVAINTPFKGAELVRRQGRPAEGRHALQIEFNRRLHLDEATLQKNGRHPILHAMVDRLIDRLAAFCREQV